MVPNLISSGPRPARPTETGHGAPCQPSFTLEELFHLLQRFWESFVFPANDIQVHKSSHFPADHQKDNIKSAKTGESHQSYPPCRRHSRSYRHHTKFTEYLFGLFSNLAATPNSISLLGVPLSYGIYAFCRKPEHCMGIHEVSFQVKPHTLHYNEILFVSSDHITFYITLKMRKNG